MWMQCHWRPEDGAGCPAAGATGVCEHTAGATGACEPHNVGAGDQTIGSARAIYSLSHQTNSPALILLT